MRRDVTVDGRLIPVNLNLTENSLQFVSGLGYLSCKGVWQDFLMKRLFSLFLVAAFLALAGDLAGFVPDKKPIGETDPPKNFTNSIGMKFVWKRPGNFVMGSPSQEAGRQKDETQHKVPLTKCFYMGVNAVTQEQGPFPKRGGAGRE